MKRESRHGHQNWRGFENSFSLETFEEIRNAAEIHFVDEWRLLVWLAWTGITNVIVAGSNCRCRQKADLVQAILFLLSLRRGMHTCNGRSTDLFLPFEVDRSYPERRRGLSCEVYSCNHFYRMNVCIFSQYRISLRSYLVESMIVEMYDKKLSQLCVKFRYFQAKWCDLSHISNSKIYAIR